jgi:polyisoprenoid-binding protein YceI
VDGTPTAVKGSLTLHGVTNELDLTINRFLCKPHFQHGREVCGADASANFDRSTYGLMYGLDGVFLPFVNLLISVEAVVPAGDSADL